MFQPEAKETPEDSADPTPEDIRDMQLLMTIPGIGYAQLVVHHGMLFYVSQ